MNIWELGSGTSVLNLLNSQKTFAARPGMNVVVMVDLSDPERLWDTMETSLGELRKIFAGVGESDSHVSILVAMSDCSGAIYNSRALDL